MKISLNKCKKGDVLISKHGKAFVYSHKDNTRPYPHIINDIITNVECSRLTNGNVFKNNRLPEDHDIVLILKDKII